MIFQERREYTADISDKVSEEEYITAMKRQVELHHSHSDGSQPKLTLIQGKSAEKTLDQMRRVEPQEEQIEKRSKKPLIFSCNCGRDLLAERNARGSVEVAAYMPSESDSSGYVSSSGDIQYQQESNDVTYSGSNKSVQYGGN